MGKKVLKSPLKSGQQISVIIYYHNTEVEYHVNLNEGPRVEVMYRKKS